MTNVNKRVKQLERVQFECKELFEKKNHDYGDAFAEFGPVGVLIRIGDKIRRLHKITKSGINMINDEKLRDTLVDLSNYAAMAVMLLDEEEENKKSRYNIDTNNLDANQAFRMTYSQENIK